jgi:hypothetical protein
MTRRVAFLALAASLSLLGCDRKKPRGPVASASFGVFFGGQIQERQEIPLVMDRAKQSLGFRVEFPEPLQQPRSIHWELDMPGAGRRVRDAQGRIGKGRLTKLGEAKARVGLARFDQELPFTPGDSIGTWNVRVLVDDEIVIDRPFLVYDRAARRRAERAQKQASADMATEDD